MIIESNWCDVNEEENHLKMKYTAIIIKIIRHDNTDGIKYMTCIQVLIISIEIKVLVYTHYKHSND